MKKQLLDLANNLENNGRFADADLLKESIERIDVLEKRWRKGKQQIKESISERKWLEGQIRRLEEAKYEKQ